MILAVDLHPALGIALTLACVACTPKGDDTTQDRSTPAPSEPAPTPTPSEPTVAEPPEPALPSEPPSPPTPVAAPEHPPMSPVHDEILTVADGSIPSWCDVDAEIVVPTDVGSYEHTVTAVFGKLVERDDLCADQTVDMPGCSTDGPWWVNHDYNISLIVPLGGDRFGQIAELSDWSDGTEETALVHDASVWSSGASLEVMNAERKCFDEDGDEEICGSFETERLQIVVIDLEDGSFLLVRATIDAEDRRTPDQLPDTPEVEILGNIAKIEACNGRTHVELPKREPTDEDDDAGPPISAAEAKAAGERCNEGWKKLGAGDLAGAKQDIDAALELLERAVDERGRRSLGACLYNRGQIAEREDDESQAIELYQESLAARPNDVVQRRLDKLLK